MKRRIAILGSTGSIGESALEVVRQNPGLFEVVGLAAGGNVDLLARQITEFSPRIVSVKDDNVRAELKKRYNGGVEILSGIAGVCAVAVYETVETVLSAMVGAMGLKPTYEAIRAGKTIALANKETLVAAGSLMMEAARERRVTILPVDSEHSAVFQSLQGHRREDVAKIILTASGGPFWKYHGDFSKVTVEEALRHPNWSMGPKITIDSATMMNKGLELIEAHWLFGVPGEKIDIVVHPESIVHSMVEYRDGSVVAQMSVPDMKGPIAYALAWPARTTSGIERLDLPRLATLSFFEADNGRFPMIGLAREAIRSGGSVPAAMNAANEAAVEAFLNRKIGFTDIYKIVAGVIAAHRPVTIKNVEDVFAVDREARVLAAQMIGR